MKMDQFQINKTLSKSGIESITSFYVACWGKASSMGDIIIKSSVNFTTHVLNRDELYHFKTLEK